MATILREKQKGTGESSYLIRIRYGAADAKTALQSFVKEHVTMAKSPMSKQLVKEIFFKKPLGYLPRRNAEPLAEWLFNQALKNAYLVTVPKVWVDDEQEYIVSPTLSNKKPGPKSSKNNCKL